MFNRSVIIAAVADREADEHVEMLRALPAGVAVKQPAVRDTREADLRERLVRHRRRVRVAQRLIGEQQMPPDRAQLRGRAVKHTVRSEHHPRPIPKPPVKPADLPGDWTVGVEDEQLDVRRQRRQPAAGRATLELLAPLSEQAPLGDNEPAEPWLGGGAVRERPAGADRLPRPDR